MILYGLLIESWAFSDYTALDINSHRTQDNFNLKTNSIQFNKPMQWREKKHIILVFNLLPGVYQRFVYT